MKSVTLLACVLASACTDESNVGDTPNPPTLTTLSPVVPGPTGVGTPRWAMSISTWANDAATGVAIDSTGDVVAVGTTTTEPDMGSANIPSATAAAFVTKRVASDGSERWTVHIAPQLPSLISIGGVAIAANDDVIVTGQYYGSADFGGHALTAVPAAGDMFIARYDANGHLLWVRDLGSQIGANDDGTYASAVALDATGRIFVAGGFYQAIQFGTQSASLPVGARGGFVAAFDAAGDLQWGRGFAATSADTNGMAGTVNGIAIAPNGDAIVVGQFDATTSFGGDAVDPGARYRGFVARYTNDGTYLASDAIGAAAPRASEAAQVAIDAQGHTAVQTGEFPDTSSAAASAGVYVLDDLGVEIWGTTISPHDVTNPQRGLSTTPSGLIISGAWLDNPLVGPPTGSMQVLAFDDTGAMGTTTYGSRATAAVGQTETFASAVGSTGAVAFSGQLSGDVNFGTGTVVAHAGDDTDAFIVLFNAPM